MEITCDNCESKKVVKNVQLCWVEYDYNHKTGKYGKIHQEDDSLENRHYCEKCFEEWQNGDL